MNDWVLAGVQIAMFTTMLVILGVSVYNDCSLLMSEYIAIAVALIVCGSIISFLSGIIRCFSFICNACPQMPMLKATLSAFYGTALLIAIILVDTRCNAHKAYVGGAAAAYFVLILTLVSQVWVLV